MESLLKSLADFGHLAIQASLAVTSIMDSLLFTAFVICSGVNGIRRCLWEMKAWRSPQKDRSTSRTK